MVASRRIMKQPSNRDNEGCILIGITDLHECHLKSVHILIERLLNAIVYLKKHVSPLAILK